MTPPESLESPLLSTIASLLLAVAELPEADLAPAAWYGKYHRHALELSSLQVVQLVDLIEASLDIVLTSDDVVRAHFATAEALVLHLSERGLT